MHECCNLHKLNTRDRSNTPYTIQKPNSHVLARQIFRLLVQLHQEDETSQIAIHMTLITTSMPFFSPPSYLKLHMPSFSLFQYAPVAECMPRLPTFRSEPTSALSVPLGRGSERCCMIVLLTANLKGGFASADGLDSEMRDWRILFWKACLRFLVWSSILVLVRRRESTCISK